MIKEKAITIVIIILVAISVVSGGILLTYFNSIKKAEKDFEDLAFIFEESVGDLGQATKINKERKEFKEKIIEIDFQNLHERNEDILAWILIPNSKINYPLMHTPENPEYYLYRNLDREYSASGVPFIDGKSSLDPQSDNILIHGHNMKNGSMFAQLLQYRDEKFLKDHPYIEFYTPEGKDIYDIISVFPTESYQSADFDYHNFINARDREEFDEYIRQVKYYSLFETGIDSSYGDKLITLSTCAYHTSNGRFVVIAKKR